MRKKERKRAALRESTTMYDKIKKKVSAGRKKKQSRLHNGVSKYLKCS